MVTKGRREIVGDLTTPASGQFTLNLLAPRNDWDDVREIVCVQQCETLPVVEATVKIDRFDVKLEVFEESKKLSEDVAGGTPSYRRRYRQRVPFILGEP